jgi:hypothetical protein
MGLISPNHPRWALRVTDLQVRRAMTCPRSHSMSVVGLDFIPGLSDTKASQGLSMDHQDCKGEEEEGALGHWLTGTQAHRAAQTLTLAQRMESERLHGAPPQSPAPDLSCPRQLCPPGQGQVDLGRGESLWAWGCCQGLKK